MTQEVRITRNYSIKFDGKVEDYVAIADSQSQEMGWGVLDSLDAGDATGFWLRMAGVGAEEDGIYVYQRDDCDPPFTVSVIYDDDLFVWDPPLQP